MYISKLMYPIAILSFLVRLGWQFMSQSCRRGATALDGFPGLKQVAFSLCRELASPAPKHRFACLGVGLLAVEAN